MTPETVLIPGDVLDQEVQEEDGEGEGQPEDQPHVDELDVGGRGQLVRHRHVEGVKCTSLQRIAISRKVHGA